MAPSENNNKKTTATIRNMGMILSVVGAIVFSLGLVACKRGSCGTPMDRNLFMLAFGIALFFSGLYVWRSEKGTD